MFEIFENMYQGKHDMTCVTSNRGTWGIGNLNLEKNEKKWENILMKFEILPFLLPRLLSPVFAKYNSCDLCQ